MAALDVHGVPTVPRRRGFTSVRIATAPDNRELVTWAQYMVGPIASLLEQ